MLIHGRHERGNLLTVEPESGRVRPVNTGGPVGYIRLRGSDGQLWYHTGEGREVWQLDLPDGRPELLARVPADAPGGIVDVTCDGRAILLQEKVQDLTAYPIPTTMDLERFWHYFARPRTGRIWAYDVAGGALSLVVEVHDVCADHIDACPDDPGLLRYCLDMYDAYGQRAWSVRLDGSQRRKIRPQMRASW